MNVFKVAVIVLLLFVCQAFQPLPAQYILKMERFDVPENLLWAIAGDKDMDNPQERLAFFASLPETEYLNKAKAEGKVLEKNASTIYVNGNNFAAESMMPGEGKMTFIYLENGDIYMVMWQKKKVIKTSETEIKQMKDNAMAMMGQVQQNMPDMDALSKYMTEEQKQQMKDAMSKLQGMNRGNAEQMPGQKEKVAVSRPGKKRTLLDTGAELYLARTSDEVVGIWAVAHDQALADKFHKMSEQMTAAFELQDMDEIKDWEIIPGKFPAAKTTAGKGMWGGKMHVAVEYYTSIEKKTPSADKFVPPGKAEGFTQGTLTDLMPDMKGGR